MEKLSRLSFAIEVFEGALAIMPTVDEIPLTELIVSFENANGYGPNGGYGGLIPQWFNYGPLDRYFLGEFDPESYFWHRDHIYLLGCNCGEVGCWPLAARVTAEVDKIVWDSFQQPRRPERDYSQFGPFSFQGEHYRRVVAGLQADFSARVSKSK